MNEVKLKPCPFCGGEAEIIKIAKNYDGKDGAIIDTFEVKCCDCEAKSKHYYSDIRLSDKGELIVNANGALLAIEAWNRRVTDERV